MRMLILVNSLQILERLVLTLPIQGDQIAPLDAGPHINASDNDGENRNKQQIESSYEHTRVLVGDNLADSSSHKKEGANESGKSKIDNVGAFKLEFGAFLT